MLKVLLSPEAENDIADICTYILKADGIDQANQIADRLEQAVFSLANLPERGKCPPELSRIGIMEFREIQSPPWRIFYQVTEKNDERTVWIMAVLDSRRGLEELLQRRLIG